MPPDTSDHGCSSSSHQRVTTGSLVRPCSRPGLLVISGPLSDHRQVERDGEDRHLGVLPAQQRAGAAPSASIAIAASARLERRSHCVVEERLRVEVRLILETRGAHGRDNGFHCDEESGFRALRPGTASGTTWSIGLRRRPFARPDRQIDRWLLLGAAAKATRAPAGRAAPPFEQGGQNV